MSQNSITVLSEYWVLESERSRFLELLPEITKSLEQLGAREIAFFEGTDQPGLFVEEFIVEDMAAYEQLKKSRHEEQAPVWEQFHSCVRGGKNKVHVWAFSRLEQ